MSKLDDLLQGVNVEWVDLGNIAKIFSGGTPNTSKAEFYDGDIPWIRSGEVNFNVITTSARNITKQGLSGSSAKLIRKNSVVLAMTGATVGRSAVIQFETSSNQSVAAIETNENIIFYKYLYYILENNYQDMKNAGQGALTSLNLSMIKKFKIPIPCPNNPEKSLEIQQEIVRILDQLTETTNKLKTELENERQIRKKQFEFYREELLSFEGQDMRLVKLGELCKIASGKNKGRSDNGKYALYGSTGIIGKTNVKKFDSERILVARVGANAGFAYIVNGEYDVSDNALVIDKCDNILTKFLFYYLFNMNLNQFAKGAGQPLITGTFLKNLIIPIPSLEEQERIVNLLDQFDAADTAIEEEITKEIKLRTQQYEYYREKLLTF